MRKSNAPEPEELVCVLSRTHNTTRSASSKKRSNEEFVEDNEGDSESLTGLPPSSRHLPKRCPTAVNSGSISEATSSGAEGRGIQASPSPKRRRLPRSPNPTTSPRQTFNISFQLGLPTSPCPPNSVASTLSPPLAEVNCWKTWPASSLKSRNTASVDDVAKLLSIPRWERPLAQHQPAVGEEKRVTYINLVKLSENFRAKKEREEEEDLEWEGKDLVEKWIEEGGES